MEFSIFVKRYKYKDRKFFNVSKNKTSSRLRHAEFISAYCLKKIIFANILKTSFVYIVSNYKRNVLYIGVTSNLYNRILQHKNGIGSEFTTKYKCTDLLYYEIYYDIKEAIKREKALKNWHKDWKLNLIKETNPELKDLFEQLDFNVY